ncbi:uncharacterized protein APUU_80299S [Aspergillus puulaauensis]|uniref:Uncharacterized protein n=1 Tax=Aspergillus puulaauensis TaxID=1220207 RepID=A0A7R8AT20_9EURO|nr:uncharacterized protein APUU_80299S [Aspergillus puulaauensis]BCS29996.1 hypothetical protein APUU_80299S [Aspergillus puulaauensis]
MMSQVHLSQALPQLDLAPGGLGEPVQEFDIELVAQIVGVLDGDNEVFGEHDRRYIRFIYRILRALNPNVSDEEDRRHSLLNLLCAMVYYSSVC